MARPVRLAGRLRRLASSSLCPTRGHWALGERRKRKWRARYDSLGGYAALHRLPYAGHEDTGPSVEGGSVNGAPGTTRTYDPQLRKLMLYPTELRARGWFSLKIWKTGSLTLANAVSGGGESGIRTHGTLPYTRFPSVRLKPLGHLSLNCPERALPSWFPPIRVTNPWAKSNWRRGRDSNPRTVARYTLSRGAPSATRPPLHEVGEDRGSYPDSQPRSYPGPQRLSNWASPRRTGPRSRKWRRGWDSNPRTLARCRFSRPVPSTARPPLREGIILARICMDPGPMERIEADSGSTQHSSVQPGVGLIRITPKNRTRSESTNALPRRAPATFRYARRDFSSPGDPRNVRGWTSSRP